VLDDEAARGLRERAGGLPAWGAGLSEAGRPEIRGSIGSYVDRVLTVIPVDGGYEVHGDDSQVVAWLESGWDRSVVGCVTRGGSWDFELHRDNRVTARRAGVDHDVVARYRPGLVSGGSIELRDGTRLRFRPPALGETWRVRSGMRRDILRVRAQGASREIRFEPPAREVHDLALLTMLALHLVAVEGNRVNAGVTGAPS
jgi:hypothetical protein